MQVHQDNFVSILSWFINGLELQAVEMNWLKATYQQFSSGHLLDQSQVNNENTRTMKSIKSFKNKSTGIIMTWPRCLYLLTLNWLHTLPWCFHCWPWKKFPGGSGFCLDEIFALQIWKVSALLNKWKTCHFFALWFAGFMLLAKQKAFVNFICF